MIPTTETGAFLPCYHYTNSLCCGADGIRTRNSLPHILRGFSIVKATTPFLCSRGESNAYLRFRRPISCPLNDRSIFELSDRIELSSHPYQGRIIAFIRQEHIVRRTVNLTVGNASGSASTIPFHDAPHTILASSAIYLREYRDSSPRVVIKSTSFRQHDI